MVVLSGILQGMYPLQLVWAGQVSHGHCLLRHELGTEQGHKWGAPGGVEPWRGMSVFHPNTPFCQADLERGAGPGSHD